MFFLVEGNPIIYWIIRTLVLIIFIITGWWISKNYKRREDFWLNCLPAIIIYSLAEGLRWGRESDYLHYYLDLTGHLFADYNELLYLFWIHIFKSTGLPFWCGFVFYSFILIFSFLYLIKRIPQIALYALPLFFIITSSQSENLIRQYFALAFIIFAIAFYFDKRYWWMFISFVAAEGIHFSAVIPIFLIILCHFISNYYKPKRPILLVIVFLSFFFLWDNSYFSLITDLIQQYAPETNTRADGYLQSSTFFSADGSLAMKSGKKWVGRSLANRTIVLLVYLFIIVAGYMTARAI